MNFDEITDTIKGKLYERVGNTFLFSYSILFISINWRFFYQIYNSYKLEKIENFLQQFPIDTISPFQYASLYTFIMPVLVLITESYQELVKTGTLKLRNFMRKKWQEIELTTASEIEEKYINKIKALENKIANVEDQFNIISGNLVTWFKSNNQLNNNVGIIFHKSSEILSIGEVAVNIDGIASRFTSSNYPILGIVIYKASPTYSFILNYGEVPEHICDIAQYQNINADGTYILSNQYPSRIEILTNGKKGKFNQVGIKSGNKFKVELKNLQVN